MIWALFTLIATIAQTLRNALQRDLTEAVGVVGATHVRFLFGFPFALLFLFAMAKGTGEAVPAMPAAVFPLTAFAALAQIGATALMLQAMRSKSFVVTIAYTKTEPVLVALFGAIFLREFLAWPAIVAILIATSGVVLTAWPKPGGARVSLAAPLLGIASAALFAVSAIGFRAAIHALPAGGFGIRASTILALGLGMQSLALSLYLLVSDRGAFRAILAAWRPSLSAGFMGAFASQMWFLGFALTSAANVRTLALIEVVFARLISGRMFRESPSPREGAGLLLIVLGVALLLNQ